MSDLSFQELGLPKELLQAVLELGFENPSGIQAAAIPAAMSGEDIVGLSQTGSGKTAAFGLPVLAKLDIDDASPQLSLIHI